MIIKVCRGVKISRTPPRPPFHTRETEGPEPEKSSGGLLMFGQRLACDRVPGPEARAPAAQTRYPAIRLKYGAAGHQFACLLACLLVEGLSKD